LHNENDLNSDLSKSAQEAYDAVNASPHCSYGVSWRDLYVVFRNSRRLVIEANGLLPTTDEELIAMVNVMRDNHDWIRRLLLLVAIENLFKAASKYAMEVLWAYGEEFELVRMINEYLAETDEVAEIAEQVKARLEAVCA
jgi:hypothetical protein